METQRKTFVLTNKKTYRRGVRVFFRGGDNKLAERMIPFSTEHLVDEKQRHTNARKISAEYTTTDPTLINAFYHDSAYGKDFVEKNDPQGKLKKKTIVITEDDAEKIALEGLFRATPLTFDGNKAVDVLKAEYAIYMQAASGTKLKESTAKEIPMAPINIEADILSAKAKARDAYKEKYGEDVPAIVTNDTAFLDGLSNPDFDALKYIRAAEKKAEEQIALEKEELRATYAEKFGKNVPNMYKNNVDWIRGKLNE